MTMDDSEASPIPTSTATEEEVDEKPIKAEEEDDGSLLQKAEQLFSDDKLDQTATILRQVNPDLLSDEHQQMLKRIGESEELVKNLKSDPDESSGWIDQGVSKGKFPTRILHKLEENDDQKELRVRCETPIPKDMLEPLLSVLNETQLYKTWLPNFSKPRFQVQLCEKLKQSGRVSQIIMVVLDLPWPMSPRELVLSAAAFDNIETSKNHIGIKLKSIVEGDDEVVPKADPTCVSVTIDGGFLFEKCPDDHPCMEHIEHKDEEGMILVTFSAIMNPNLSLLPQSILNFLVKIAFGTAWKMLLKVATDIKDGKRPDHADVIKEKDEFYSYVRERLNIMLSIMDNVSMQQS